MNLLHIGPVMEVQNLLLEPSDKTDHEEQKLFYILLKILLEFLEEFKIRELLTKYNKFMPIPIKFGTKKEALPKPEDAAEDYKAEVYRSRQHH